MGISFAAGTTDGPGSDSFEQASTSDPSPFWKMLRNMLASPSVEEIQCHSPKPILIPTGKMNIPYPWQPSIVPTQLLRFGDVIIVALPGEFTTMSGRRLRNAIHKTILEKTGNRADVILAGLSNIYASYVTTPEEYQIQRYEGASTIYGPHTLTLYVDQYVRLAKAMITNSPIQLGPIPPSFDSKLISLTLPVITDIAPFGRKFGDVSRQPALQYKRGDRVHVQFISGNLRNDIHQDKTYLTVELQNMTDGSWSVIATDSNWETRLLFKPPDVSNIRKKRLFCLFVFSDSFGKQQQSLDIVA